MKKCIALFFALLLCFLLPVSSQAVGFAVPDSVPVSSASTYIFNLDTGLPVVDQNSHERRDIASLTKMMTCLLLVENVPDLDNTMITADTAVFVYPVVGANGSTADIRPGEIVSARSLLYAMLLPSGNEAAAVAAYYVGKENLENFYAMMNARAKELGCVDTNFTNPHGLLGMDTGNYSSAYDLALIAQACWQQEAIRTAAGAPTYDMPFTNIHTTAQNPEKPESAYTIYNTNRMVIASTAVYRDYIKGLKTGTTTAAGRTFAGVAVNSRGETYVGVFLGAPMEAAPDGSAYTFYDAANLFDWVFANFAVQPSLDTTVPIHEVPVELSSDTDIVKLLPSADLKTILPLEGGAGLLEHSFDVPESVNAPIHAGDKLGTVTLSLQGEAIGTVDLVAAYDVERNPLLNILFGIGEFFKSTYFRVVLILTGIYILLYFSIMVWLRTTQRKRRLSMQRRAANLSGAPREELGGAPPARTGRNDRNGSVHRAAPPSAAGKRQTGSNAAPYKANSRATGQFAAQHQTSTHGTGPFTPPYKASGRPTERFNAPGTTSSRTPSASSAPSAGHGATPTRSPQSRRPRS